MKTLKSYAKKSIPYAIGAGVAVLAIVFDAPGASSVVNAAKNLKNSLFGAKAA